MRWLVAFLLVSGCTFPASFSDDAPSCIVDPSDGVEKECAHLTAEGKCVHFGATCSPSDDAESCVVDPDDGIAKECFHVTADGSCAHSSGAPC